MKCTKKLPGEQGSRSSQRTRARVTDSLVRFAGFECAGLPTLHTLCAFMVTHASKRQKKRFAGNAARTCMEDDLLDAAHAGDSSKVRRLLWQEHGWQSGSLQQALHAAAYQGHEATVAALVGARADANAWQQDGSTPLGAACGGGHTEAARTLIGLNAFVDHPADDVGTTPLHIACSVGSRQVAELLMLARADLNRADVHGSTALYWASVSGHEHCALCLIASHAAVNKSRTDDGRTPLAAACAAGVTAIVKLLLSAQAEVELADAYDTSPLAIAAFCGHASCVDALLEGGAGIDVVNRRGETALHAVSGMGLLPSVQQLVDRGASLHVSSARGEVPLHWAAASGHRAVAAFLLDCGSEPSFLATGGAASTAPEGAEGGVAATTFVPPLHTACSAGALGIAHDLIRAGASVDQRSTSGSTALHAACAGGDTACVQLMLPFHPMLDAHGTSALAIACAHGHAECVGQLIDAAADVSQADDQGTRPLAIAAATGHTLCVRKLLEAGAAVNSVDASGDGALHAAAECGHADCVLALLNARAAIDAVAPARGITPLALAAAHGCTLCVDLLLRRGAHPDAYDAAALGRRTPLLRACEQPHHRAECVRLLLVAKASANRVDTLCGRASLHYVAAAGDAEALGQLLDAQADCNVRATEGDQDPAMVTPLWLASSAGHIACVTLLLRADGCDADLPTARGSTPILAASRAGHLEVVRRLADARANLDACDDELRTPLTSAFEAGDSEVAQVLLEAHARGRQANPTTARTPRVSGAGAAQYRAAPPSAASGESTGSRWHRAGAREAAALP